MADPTTPPVVLLSRPTHAQQIAEKCVHFTGISQTTCNAGVAYASVQREHPPIPYRRGSGAVYESRRSLPCVDSLNLGGAACEKRCMPTPEAVAAKVEADNRAVEAMLTARHAIVQVTDGRRGVHGSIACPACKSGSLTYSVAGSNGHIHARCSTDGCVAWME